MAKAPHSIAAIVAKCLAPRPDDRYQSVEQLRVDLERHLENLPLAHAPDASPRERLVKWARRHPRLSSATSIGAFADDPDFQSPRRVLQHPSERDGDGDSHQK